ncbi:hypothetical protein BDW75DRAFT_232086 [Aspergillus navahoensis]
MAHPPENKVCPSPYTRPGPHQIVVKNRALAINSVDWDIAGTVVEVGEGVERFRVGDRVVAMTSAVSINTALEGGFQLYTVASVLPLALLTASHSLFDSAYLGLGLPTVPARNSDSKHAVIITGGASAVGSTAIQLAVSAGCEVVSTASPKNFNYVRKLGAAHVFDYKSDTVIGRISAAPGSGTVDPSAQVKFTLLGPHAVGKDSVVAKVYTSYLPDALARGQFVPAPEAVVVGERLESIQEAFAVHMQGVSAKKNVVSLDE